METRTFIWRGLIAICVLLAMVCPAAAQIDGQLTEFAITGPGNLATPYRTSNDTVGIAFSHNAGTGSLFINTNGADIEGSSFIGTGGAAGTPVCPAFLNTDGIKTINLVALTIAWLLGGVVVIEVVFNFPGLGRLMIDAVSDRDLAMVQAIALILAAIYVTLNLIADLLTLFANPKLRTMRI